MNLTVNTEKILKIMKTKKKPFTLGHKLVLLDIPCMYDLDCWAL